MKTVKLSSVVLMALTAAACSVHVGTDPQPPRAAAPPAPRPVAPPAPAHPGPVVGAMGHTGSTPAPAAPVQHVAPGASMGVSEALNVSRIQALAQRSPKGCGFAEVAPNKWVKIDCHAYTPAVKAIAHLSPAKAKVAQAHALNWKPFNSIAAQLRASGGGFLKGGGAQSVSAANPGGLPANIIKADAVPGTIDHRTDNTEGPIKDQGPVGSCTAFSLSAAIDNAAIRAGKMTAGNAQQATSPNHVWSHYGIPQMGNAADATLNQTIATMQIWPQNNKEACELANAMYEQDCGYEEHVTPGTWNSDSALVAKKNQSESGGSYKVTAIEQLTAPPQTTDEIVTTLASGASIWIAMRIDGAMWSSAKMANGVIPDWSNPNGGHAIEMAGYRQTAAGKQFLIHNSWGTSWGDAGYAWVSEAMVLKNMNYAYRVKLDGPAAPPGQATDDDCAPTQLVDIFSGLCALICPDGSRSNNGCGIPH